MIKLLDILENKILVPRRPREERAKNYLIATQKKIQQYVKNGGKGGLDLHGAPITSLPPGLTVGGYLDLDNASITSLPPGLNVGDSLYLGNTKITSLPPDLKVGGGISLNNTPIVSLPPDLKIGGNLDLGNTPLSKSYTREQIRQMVPGVKGYIYM